MDYMHLMQRSATEKPKEEVKIEDETPGTSRTSASWEIHETTSSTHTISICNGFFDEFWPLMLVYNSYDIDSKDRLPYFQPTPPLLDVEWAHTLLSAKGYGGYSKPYIFRYGKSGDTEMETEKQQEQETNQAEKVEESEEDNAYRSEKLNIKQFNYDANAKEELDDSGRKKLLDEFVCRKLPWYMKKEECQLQSPILDNIENDDSLDSFEKELIKNIGAFNCNLMIIDVNMSVGLAAMERFIKFRRYVQMVAVVRCPLFHKELSAAGSNFGVVVLDEPEEASWSQILNESVDLGVKYANEMYLTAESGRPFIFIFAKNRNEKDFNHFTVLGSRIDVPN